MLLLAVVQASSVYLYSDISAARLHSATCSELPPIVSISKNPVLLFEPVLSLHPYSQWISLAPKGFCIYSSWVTMTAALVAVSLSSLSKTVTQLNPFFWSFSLYFALFLSWHTGLVKWIYLYRLLMEALKEGLVLLTLWTLCLRELMVCSHCPRNACYLNSTLFFYRVVNLQATFRVSESIVKPGIHTHTQTML